LPIEGDAANSNIILLSCGLGDPAMHTKAQIQTGKREEQTFVAQSAKQRAITTASGAPPFNHVPLVRSDSNQ
jgi:hypothetical protein